MLIYDIKLNTIDDVKRFNAICVKLPYNIDLRSGQYLVNAKSIMSIFGLDLSHPVEMCLHTTECDLTLFEEFIVTKAGCDD